MVSSVVKARFLSLEEVRSWTWRRLLRTYRQIGRSHWDEFLAEVQASEIGTARAIALNFGAKNLPDLPTYEQVHTDPWEAPPPPKPLSARWQKYLEANGFER